MDPQTPSAAAGWYADPETPGRLRFWDGSSWTARAEATSTFGRQPTPVGRPFARLSRLVEGGLTLVVLIAFAQVAVDVWGLRMFGDAVDTGDLAQARRFDDLNQACGIATLVAVLLTGITWCFWQHRLARATMPGNLRREPVMHAGSWFIPWVNLWFPVQNMRDLWRHFVGTAGAGLVGWWWLTVLLGALFTRISRAVSDSVSSVSEFNGAVSTDLVATGLVLVSAVLAVVIVRRLTLAGLARSAGLSPAAPQSA